MTEVKKEEPAQSPVPTLGEMYAAAAKACRSMECEYLRGSIGGITIVVSTADELWVSAEYRGNRRTIVSRDWARIKRDGRAMVTVHQSIHHLVFRFQALERERWRNSFIGRISTAFKGLRGKRWDA